MKNIAIITAAALVTATVGSAAMAQESDFNTADGNKDGVISWEEALGAIPTLTEDQYNTADANADGSLDEGEFTGLVTLFGTSSAAQ